MFSSHGLFSSTPCPDRDRCKRPQCIFSHSPDAKYQDLPTIPVSKPVAGPSNSSKVSYANTSVSKGISASMTATATVPAKRPASAIKSYASTSNTSLSNEPPKKVQKTAASSQAPKKVATEVVSESHMVSMCVLNFSHQSGCPILTVSPATSQVAIPVRQVCFLTLLKLTLD